LRYIPDDALIVEATSAETMQQLRAQEGVRIVVPFFAGWKLSPEFKPASVFSKGDREQVLIRLLKASEREHVIGAIEGMSSAEVVTSGGRTIIAEMTREQLQKTAALEGVEWIQPNPQMEMFDFKITDGDSDSGTPPGNETAPGDYTDLTGYESGTKLMNFQDAWGRGLFGAGQVASMADTGLDTGDTNNLHGDFHGRVTGQAFGMFSTTWDDPMGHGTHVAGSITGDGQASKGMLRGGAPEARFIAQGMWSTLLKNLSVPPKLGDMFGKAYAEGARIHSNSWGSPRNLGGYDSFATQVDEFMFANPDFLLIFAAGNSGVDKDKDGRIDPGSVSTPGTAKNTLTVGASENVVFKGGIQKKLKELRGGPENWGAEPIASDTLSNNENGIAAFSSRGPTQDGRTKPDVVAPGTNILSARSHHPEAQPLWGAYNNDYVWSGGTSMATPLVAGAATLVREHLVKSKGIAEPSAAVVKGVLMHTALDLFPGQFGEVGKAAGQELVTHRPNSDEGYGRVDVTRATSLEQATIVDEKTGVGTGDVLSFPIEVGAAGKMTVTLVWTDAPGAPGATKALVNDLDLVIVDHDNRAVTTSADNINNNEIFEQDVAAGTYEVQVRGANVPQGKNGKQPFALIMSAPGRP
jgi:serine protease AprX